MEDLTITSERYQDDPEHAIDELIDHLNRGFLEPIYQQAHGGHPKDYIGSTPPEAQAPTELEPLEAEDDPC